MRNRALDFRDFVSLLISEFPKFRLPTDPNQQYIPCRPVPQRGVRTSRTRGGMRWTRAVPLTNGAEAYGQVVSFWRPNAGVKAAIRSAGDGVKQAWSPGRARSKPENRCPGNAGSFRWDRGDYAQVSS